MRTSDFLIIGGGIAGASAAYELSALGSVIALERENRPDYHASGRSTATFVESYGNRVVRALTTASRGFYEHPPAGFSDAPLLADRGCLYLARAEQMASLGALEKAAPEGALQRLDQAAVQEIVPALRRGYAAAGLLEAAAADMDVNAIHHGYLRALKAAGGSLVTSAGVTALKRDAGAWVAQTPAGTFAAPIVINAAGAWADPIAQLAGLSALGLQARRRTVVTYRPPADLDIAPWPLVRDVDEDFYFKPDSGLLLITPADETAMPPCDAQPTDLDVALACARFEDTTELTVERIETKWAGLRTFAPDNTPVTGFDPRADGFFWFAGQGGYGFQTAPALARAARCLVDGSDLPAELAALGVTAADLDPRRLL